MKKVIALLLILIMAFAFVACGDDTGDNGGGTPQLPGAGNNSDYNGDGTGIDTDPIPIPPESLTDIDNAFNNK